MRRKAAAVIENIDNTTDRQQAVRTLDGIIKDENTYQRDRIRAVEVRAKLAGLLENPPLENPERERELSAVETREAQLFALWRFSPAGVAAAATLALAAEQPPPQPAE